MKHILFVAVISFVFFACRSGSMKSDQKDGQPTISNNTPKTLNSEMAENTMPKKEVCLDNMVFFKGGVFTIGRNNGLPQEAPAHEVSVAPFYIDKDLVTVDRFRAFIKATNHVTEAERFGDSGVFSFETGQWSLTPKTTWEYPLGPNDKKAQGDHPVTHVSWRDALAYAKWLGKRLVTEAEWEYAARNGGTTTFNYPWGDSPQRNGRWLSNVFQGTVTDYKVEDGYLYTSPVGAFGETPSGLTDMAGNVWEWMADVYRPYPGNQMPFQENMEVKSTRGGSFMFDEASDMSYSVYFRSLNSAETSLFNTGFRCAYTPEPGDKTN